MLKRDEIERIYTLAGGAIGGTWLAVGMWVETTDDDQQDPVQNSYDAGMSSNDLQDLQWTAQYIASVQPRVIMEMIEEIKYHRGILDDDD